MKPILWPLLLTLGCGGSPFQAGEGSDPPAPDIEASTFAGSSVTMGTDASSSTDSSAQRGEGDGSSLMMQVLPDGSDERDAQADSSPDTSDAGEAGPSGVVPTSPDGTGMCTFCIEESIPYAQILGACTAAQPIAYTGMGTCANFRCTSDVAGATCGAVTP